jgi:hypothetical protein
MTTVSIFCVCRLYICVIVSTVVLNCNVMYLHLMIMTYCKYAINYFSETKM